MGFQQKSVPILAYYPVIYVSKLNDKSDELSVVNFHPLKKNFIFIFSQKLLICNQFHNKHSGNEKLCLGPVS